MNKTAFIYLTTGATVSYCHAIAALSGELLLGGWDASQLSVVRLDGDPATYLNRTLASDPQTILMSVMSNQWPRASGLAHEIRATAPATVIGIGGSHAIADYRSVVEENVFDFVFTGEADKDLADILSGPYRTYRGFEGTRIFPGTTIDSLDDLARPAIELFAVDDILEYPSVIFSRGCPYRCTYCMSRRGGIGGRVRWKSPARAIQEVQELSRYAHPELINFDDDTLLKSPAWLREFLQLYQEQVGLPFHCNARPETMTAELAGLLAQAGCAAIGIGIESGSARIRAEVLQRPMSDERIVRAFDLAHDQGLRTWSFNMVGLPTETVDDVQATIALNERCGADWLRVSIYTPYPGTPLADGMGLIRLDASYFRSTDTLPSDVAACASNWLRELAAAGRLWYTKAELATLLKQLCKEEMKGTL